MKPNTVILVSRADYAELICHPTSDRVEYDVLAAHDEPLPVRFDDVPAATREPIRYERKSGRVHRFCYPVRGYRRGLNIAMTEDLEAGPLGQLLVFARLFERQELEARKELSVQVEYSGRLLNQISNASFWKRLKYLFTKELEE